MTQPDLLEAHRRTVEAAIAAGRRLHAAVTLSYVGYGSDKFWTGVWVEDTVVVNFGRHGAVGQTHEVVYTDATAAAKRLWQLLRSKTGKGYAVVDAAVFVAQPDPTGSGTPAGSVVRQWDALRRARAANPTRPLLRPDLQGVSPRTPTQGARVLLDLTSATPSVDTLVAAAVADPTERFLPPLVLSRPDAPEEARFLAALVGSPGIH